MPSYLPTLMPRSDSCISATAALQQPRGSPAMCRAMGTSQPLDALQRQLNPAKVEITKR